VHLPEAALEGCGLGGTGRRPRARMLGAHGEVPERDAQLQLAQPDVLQAAEVALEVGVLDDERSLGRPPDVVVGAERRDGRAGEVGQAARASNSRLAPGRSPGDGAS
jgi:hypothetical protein